MQVDGIYMRRLLIAGNWKMNGSSSFVRSLLDEIKSNANEFSNIDIVVIPPFVYLNEAHKILAGSLVKLGAQNLYVGKEGAFTGEVSGAMLKDVGCKYVLVGHSERRSLFHDDLALSAAKFKSAQEAGLTPILCVGETKQQREKGKTEITVREQLDSVISLTGVAAFANAVIAYEPVWAIGTGLTATPQQAQDVHAYIRRLFAQNNVDIANTLRILYGGSMKADNATNLLAMPDIDGGLIGGASLSAQSFLAICESAKQSLHVTEAEKRG